MIGAFPENKWYLYDDMSGNIVLKHPYRPEMTVSCPHCNNFLMIDNYRDKCCGNEFKIGFGEIRQIKPVGQHKNVQGRGWQSLRLYEP